MSAKQWFGPPPPAELSSAELLSQGAEARIWLLSLPQQQLDNTADGCGTDKSNMNNDDKTMPSSTRTHHVGGGLHVPHIMHISQLPSQPPHHQQQQPPSPSPIIVKERFSKKYRHPSLDISLTKNRTKGEARSLIRCLKAGVSCPIVLGIAHWPSSSSSSSINSNMDTNTASTSSSSCLFLEWIQGCTVRQYLEHRSSTTSGVNAGGSNGLPSPKRPRYNSDAKEKDDSNSITSQTPPKGQDRITTPIDSQTLCVARNLGQLVGKMHAAGIIHGDLTTSNIMLKNPPWAGSSGGSGNKPIDGNEGCDGGDDGIPMQHWTPQLVLIDFGLASSTTSTNTNASNKSNNNNNKQQHNAEEKAVDLYVLERAFLSSHPESERLVEELMDGYREYFVSLDGRTITSDGDVPLDEKMVDATSATATRPTSEGTHGHAAKMILNRLDQVRLRGRKRECFG